MPDARRSEMRKVIADIDAAIREGGLRLIFERPPGPDADVPAQPHMHTWTGLYSTFGPYGPQDKHLHQCFDCDDVTLIGDGRDCVIRAHHEVVADGPHHGPPPAKRPPTPCACGANDRVWRVTPGGAIDAWCPRCGESGGHDELTQAELGGDVIYLP